MSVKIVLKLKMVSKGVKVNDPVALNREAYLWAEKGINLVEAKKLIDIALAKRPNNPKYIDTLGWIYYKQGKYKAAETQLKKSLNLNPNIIVFDHLGDTYDKLGENNLAVKAWQDGVKLAKKKDEKLKEIILKKVAQQVAIVNDGNNSGGK